MPKYLPNTSRAGIDPRELCDYVLNPKHETGKYKAAFFAQMGYTAENWKIVDHE